MKIVGTKETGYQKTSSFLVRKEDKQVKPEPGEKPEPNKKNEK